LAKKTGGAFLKRHRLKDGIPKEEEEKPRKEILQQTMVQCNSYFFRRGPEPCCFPICFSDVSDHVMRYAATQQHGTSSAREDLPRKVHLIIIRPLTVFDREAVRSFYLALSPDERRKRFCNALCDETISRYVDGLNFGRDTVLGAFDEHAQIAGLAELVRGAEACEMAFSVRPDSRGQSIGTKLMERLVLRARVCGVRKLFVMFLADNTPMRRMALRAGMSVRTAYGESHGARELLPANV
jgi:GNAT superfamily N-acetyltransferase